jgi:uncharacterized protein YhaN
MQDLDDFHRVLSDKDLRNAIILEIQEQMESKQIDQKRFVELHKKLDEVDHRLRGMRTQEEDFMKSLGLDSNHSEENSADVEGKIKATEGDKIVDRRKHDGTNRFNPSLSQMALGHFQIERRGMRKVG